MTLLLPLTEERWFVDENGKIRSTKEDIPGIVFAQCEKEDTVYMVANDNGGLEGFYDEYEMYLSKEEILEMFESEGDYHP